jgi:putative transposase
MRHLTYDVKSLFNLPSQSVIRLIAKVVEAYKRDIKIKPVFRELGAIQYDERNSSIELDKISLTTFRDKKRLALKTSVGDYQKERFGNISGQCDSIRKNFFIRTFMGVDRRLKKCPPPKVRRIGPIWHSLPSEQSNVVL